MTPAIPQRQNRDTLASRFCFRRTILLTLYGLSVLWFLVLFPIGIRASQRIKLGRAILVGVPAYIVYQFIFVIFNR